MSRKHEVFIMDVFGHLNRPARKPRRKRCVVCNELTHSTLYKSYRLPKSATYFDGFHCEECEKKQDELFQKEMDEEYELWRQANEMRGM